MRKLFSLCAAVLVALAVNAAGTDFSTPYNCSADAGAITGDAPSDKVYLNSTADPHQIEWSDVGKTYTSVVTWTVEATKACYISVSLDLGTAVSSNKHIFEVTLLNSESTKLGALEEGPAYTGDGFIEAEQLKALSGKLLIPAAGTYKIELRNNRDFCKGSIKAVVLSYAGEAPITDFSTPYKCSADDGLISGDAPSNKVYLNSTADPHQIEWSDVSKSYTSVISWNIIATRAGFISVTLDLGTAISSNKHIFEVTLLDSESNKLGALEEGPAYTGDGFIEAEQLKALSGKLLIPAAGNYTIELRNNRDYCKGSIKNVILSYIAAPKTLYCYVDKSWWVTGDESGNAKVNCYAKEEGVSQMSDWPGSAMTEISSGMWKIVIPANNNKINFVRVNPDQTTYWGAKTDELVVPTNSNLFTITSDEAQWDGEGHTAKGSWSVKDAKFYIAGNMTDWDDDKIGSLEDSYTMHLAAGKYQMKLVDGSDWLDLSAMTEVAGGIYPAADGSISFQLAAAGDVTVNYKKGTLFTMVGDFAAPQVAVVAEWNTWNPTADVFTPALDKKTASWKYTPTELPGSDSNFGFKVVFDGDQWLAKNGYWITRDVHSVSGLGNTGDGENLIFRPDVANKEYVFTWTYATGELDVTFPVAAAIENTEAVENVVKTFENGQLIIIKNGVKYNAQGAVVR